MRFYELRVIIDPETTAHELEERAKGVAELTKRPIKVIGATVHARPTEGIANTNDGAVFIADESGKKDRKFYTFAGRFVYMHGMPVVNVRKLGETTLSLKGDPDAADEFIMDALGNPGYSGNSDGDDEDFSIGGFDDEADEDDEFDIGVDNE